MFPVIAVIAVIPMPASVEVDHDGELALAHGATIGVADPTLVPMAMRFVDDVLADTGLRLTVLEADGQGDIRIEVDPGLAEPDPAVAGLSPTGGDPADERYRLVVTPAGVVVIGGAPEGLFRGLTTLRQMIAGAPDRSAVVGGAVVGGAVVGERRLPSVAITDAPRFAWRGLSVDVARTFHGPAQLRRVIDMLALYKLNVLHLHLSDDQGWRLEVPGWPELTRAGASGALGDRPGGSYTSDELDALVRYAADRWVTVVPEIDMPGHAGAAIRSYPELGSAANVLDPDHPRAEGFVRDVVAALAASASGAFVHIGGDEAFGMDPEAYRRSVDRARAEVTAAGKRSVLWQESARSSTAPSDVVQFWMAFDPSIEALLRSGEFDPAAMPDGMTIPVEFLPMIAEMFLAGAADVARALDRGAHILLSPASHVYLDRPYAEPPTDEAQSAMQRRLGLKIYPRLTVEQSFDWDPGVVIDATPDQLAGVEAAIWCETLADGGELEFMLLPRLPGVAERGWSPAPVSTWDEYRHRLGAQAEVWTARGWRFFTSSVVDWPSPGAQRA